MRPRLLIDFDGTLATDAWPAFGELMPGARDAMVELSEFAELYVYTSRIAPMYPDEITERDNEVEIFRLRQWLDVRGLGFMHIWTKPWKPSGAAYVDDKAYRYTGRRNAWKALTPRLRALCEAPVRDYSKEFDHATDI